MADETPCINCKEPIVSGAKKCIHCRSYQNWRRYFDVSGIVLSLTVALISVLTASIPIIKATFEPKKSDVSFSFLEYSGGNYIKVVSVNRGTRDAVLKGASLRVRRNGAFDDETYPLSFNNPNPLIKPQQVNFFNLYIKGQDGKAEGLPLGGSANSECLYQIDYNMVAFDHNPKKIDPTEFECP